ncbi:hypothetical protein Ddye_009261 [Dipteronia dyeriana]|uniref:SWIM-type domain-containing protein n=1 Tax=Dipteronia dyeriana TaxID=168575 RepID=A0AAD9XB27_9ROSI|nr:hypothetical protein Ddye_009261 [Dipteronia dyeriana]
MLLCDGGHVPEVYVSVVEKVSVQPGHLSVPTVQPVYQSFVQQLTARFQSAGGSNNVFGSIPTTDNVFQTPIENPVVFEDPTINEDESSIPEYNSYSEYELEDFDEDYIGDGRSREGVNYEVTYHHGISSNSTDGGRRGPVPPVFTGLSRDTFEDGGINVGDRSGTSVSQPWIILGASNYSFELVRTEESSSCNCLSKGGMFESKKVLKLALQEYALKENFEVRVTRSCMGRYEVGCKDPECKFQFRAIKIEGGNYWTVRKFEEQHSFTIDDLHNRHRQASAWLIGEILSPKLTVSGRSLKPKEIMTNTQVEQGLSLLYTKALRAKRLAEQNVFGSPDLSYRFLPAYCHELKLVNHGIVTAIKTDVACQDVNNQVFPLAYGWGDVECEDSWTWFLKELKKAIGCPTNCIIISDRSLAIKVTMAKIPHSLCGFHMNMNLKNRFKSHVVCNLFHEASRAHRQTEFLEKMRELSLVNMRAYEYLMRFGTHRWSRAYYPVRRYGRMTSNIVECMNNCLQYARQLPITTLVEYVRDMMHKWFHERLDAASRNTTQLSRWATEKLTKKNETSHKYMVRPIDHVNFNVKDGEKDDLVNISEKTCPCKQFQNDLLPCSHALAAIRYIFY